MSSSALACLTRHIQATGTLANGVTRTLSRPAARALHPSSTLILQPDADDGTDAYIWESQASNNYGTDDETWVSRAAATHPGVC